MTNPAMETILEALAETPVLPIIKVDSIEDTVALVDALVEEGVAALEILQRSSAALPALHAVVKRHPRLRVAAGTVTTPDLLDKVRDAGAHFAISPGLTPRLAAAVRAHAYPFVPGVQSASEVMAAREEGFSLLKYYPAVPTNGAQVLGDYVSVFPSVRFIPTGRIDLDTLPPFARLANVAAVGGSFVHSKREPHAIRETLSKVRDAFRQARAPRL